MASGVVETVRVAEVPVTGKPVLERLMQLYQHDFSEFATIGSRFGEVSEDGLFAYDWLERYWCEDGRFPFTLHADGRLAGFALVNRWSALDRGLDQSMAEFFVLRKYRRAGVGARAASLLFARFHGRWEVPVADYNAPALVFWRRTIGSIVGGAVEECAGDGIRWKGRVLRFSMLG